MLSEQSAVETFATGPAPLAVWFLVLGTAAIYGGVVLIGRDLLARMLRLLN